MSCSHVVTKCPPGPYCGRGCTPLAFYIIVDIIFAKPFSRELIGDVSSIFHSPVVKDVSQFTVSDKSIALSNSRQ